MAKTKIKKAAKKSNPIPAMAASAAPRRRIGRYAGNSAQVDDAIAAFERASAWAKSPAGTPYASSKAKARKKR